MERRHLDNFFTKWRAHLTENKHQAQFVSIGDNMKISMTEYQRGWIDGHAAACADEAARPGIHVIMGKRLCSVCGEAIKPDERCLYQLPRWWELWKTGKMFHAKCA